MRTARPLLTEAAAPLKRRRQGAQDGRKQPRLQRLSLWASGPAPTRQEVAQLLGVHRQPLGHWRARDTAGGLAAWRALYVPAGTPLAPPPAVLAARAQARRRPAGVASDDARRQGGTQTHHLAGNSHTLYASVRTAVQAKLKVPRPRHTTPP